MNKIKRVIKEPHLIITRLMDLNFFWFIPDESYLKLKYKLVMGTKLDLENPKTFNEKLQWLKLHDRNPEYTKMVDKYEAKEYVANIIEKEYIIPTLGVWDRYEDIDFDKLPNEFVLKPTHTSGNVFICKDKKSINYKKLKKQVHKWPYKNVKPRIIAEKYMEDKTGELVDYKVYAFNGKCEYVMTCVDRAKGETKFLYYDRNWNLKKDFSYDGLKYGDTVKVDKPENLDKMFEFAGILSKGIPFVRVDFYEANGKLYFGELTFFPSAGFDNTRTKACQEYLDETLKIGEKYNK